VGTSKLKARYDLAGATLLALAGVGLRLAVASRFPTLPFWDFLHLVEFGKHLRDHGFFAPGWFWSQLNPGLPVILSLLFRLPADPVVVARTATCVATGLVGLLPFLLWRGVIGDRWRLLAGALLALWPGQVLFSGVVAQDNWLLLPMVALACLAVRQFLVREPPRTVVAALLYVASASIRQEMAVVLLPLVLPAALRNAKSQARSGLTLAAVVAAGLLLLVAQRHAATGRFAWTTEHGVLALYGSFMPGASELGWEDGRAYAAALHPESGTQTFGDRKVLLEMTVQEAKRRPAFHVLRMASWIPRLALESDADNLRWSLTIPQSQPASRRGEAVLFAERWSRALVWELAAIQGLFVGAVIVAVRRRDRAILALAAAVLLKFLVHALISPVGRLVVPAIALELLAISLCLAEWQRSSRRQRVAFSAFALAFAGALTLAVPPLEALVIRRDSRILPGVQSFSVKIEGGGLAQCQLERGAIMGMGPKWAAVGIRPDDHTAQAKAKVSCVLTGLDDARARLILRDPVASRRAEAPLAVEIEADDQRLARVEMTGTLVQNYDFEPSQQRGVAPIITLEVVRPPDAPEGGLAEAPVQFEFARH
jgi:hypothetical protein